MYTVKQQETAIVHNTKTRKIFYETLSIHENMERRFAYRLKMPHVKNAFPSPTPPLTRRISVHLGASRRISAHLAAFQRISEHLGASGRISAHLGASRRIWAHLGTSRLMSAKIGTSRHISAHPGCSCVRPVLTDGPTQ